ncbi:hypothetical protein, partial [Comamonas aquatilis]|uniref:hypothetical protein n=1 Tax=Comamonas aquatilis TaxID=1778406 RepID=UPI0039F0CA4D
LGVYVFAAHSDQAARQNWAAPGSYAVAIGAPVFTAKTGFVYNGSADYHDTQLAMGGASDQNPYTTTKDISAMVWPGTEDQPTGATALGDNVISVETNRSPTQAALRTGTTNGDVVAIPALGTPLGFVRVADDRATAYVAGSNSATIVRARLTGYTQRLMYIGANNTSAGAASFYAGTIRAAQFGKSLNSVQMLAMNAAMQRFFAAIKGA